MLPRIILCAACCGFACTGVTCVGCCAAMYFCLFLMSGSDGCCGVSDGTVPTSAGRDTDCGRLVRICGVAACSGSGVWETWRFSCSRTASRVRMAGKTVSESLTARSIPVAFLFEISCFCSLSRTYFFVLISGSANCVVSGLGTVGISRRDEAGIFSFGRVRAAGGTVGAVAGADGSALAGACPSDRCSAGFAFTADFSLTDVPSSRAERLICDW